MLKLFTTQNVMKDEHEINKLLKKKTTRHLLILVEQNVPINSAMSVEHSKPEKRPKLTTPPKTNYCWHCHKVEAGDGMCCKFCPRYYHSECLAEQGDDGKYIRSYWMCPVCHIEVIDEDSKSHAAIDNYNVDRRIAILKNLCDFVAHETYKRISEGRPEEGDPFHSVVAVHSFSADSLKEAISAGDIRTYKKLQNELLWLLHNSISISGVEGNKFLPKLEEIVKKCDNEIMEAMSCENCYYNNKCLSRPDCISEFPHTLVWALVEGYCFWPAKALKLQNNATEVMLLFFGSHEYASVPMENCYLLSLEPPWRIEDRRNQKALKVALDEMQRHVEELHKNKLDFQYASKGVHFKSFNLYTWLEPEVLLPVLFQRLDTFEEYDKYPDIVELRDAMLSVAKELEEEKVDEDQPGCSGTTTN
ncbi:Protein kinase C-binding protein 1 [Trichinella papuae]|uniref:Protein kinase C-binding protein 1 n=1 Tax=Trichinella papuae TaxID=268474 RepID=A0A0V1N608_9BILA|nr:Protein kinase C-binding protein 1 [Trichinella papuae]